MTTVEKLVLAAIGGAGIVWLIASRASASEGGARSRRIADLQTGELTNPETQVPLTPEEVAVIVEEVGEYCPLQLTPPDFQVDMRWGLKSSVRAAMLADITAVTRRMSFPAGKRVYFELHGSRQNINTVADALDESFLFTSVIDVMFPGESATMVNGWIMSDEGDPGITEFEVNCG